MTPDPSPVASGPLLSTEGLGKAFVSTSGLPLARRRTEVRAVDGVSIAIQPGETLALVGESGSGKSTLGRLILRLVEPSQGRVVFDGEDLTALPLDAMRARRRQLQMIFQDPYGSLSPRRSVAEIIAEPLQVFGIGANARQRRDTVAELMTQVGLPPAVMDRFPRQFSGGQRQRIGIARAIAANPRFIVADEPVSALDVSVQAQIINLMQDLQERRGLSYLFIAHDLAVVQHIADQVAVMYLGRIVESGPKARIYTAPHHPYTQALLSAAPEPDPDRPAKRIILRGDIPSPTAVPAGCAFSSRCPIVRDVCRTDRPPLGPVAPGHLAACHFAAANPIPL